MYRRYLVSLTALSVLPLVLIGCGEKSPADPRIAAPLVRTVVVEEAKAGSRIFSGVVAARVQSDLGFRVSGKVLERLVDTGQAVKRGQPLMRIDPIDLQLAALAQQQAVAAARAQAIQAAADEARYRGLRGTGAISDSSYDQAKAASDAAQAQLSAAEAQAKVALNATAYTDLVADADGVVMETLAEPGQVVNAGQIVVRLAHAGTREAIIRLPETLRPAPGSAAHATLFGNGGHSVAATLRQLSDVADPLTRTFEARYVLQGLPADIPLGTTVSIRLAEEPSSLTNAVQVPIGALFDAGNGAGVWAISGEPATVSWRPVVVQSLADDSARISGQLQPGDLIVALGAHLLRDGEQVRLASQTIATAVKGAQP
ncbi:RND family efflux transporter MFP subunit [Rheinheimera pacifica]|uniref:efflux RND transporter periplasmic adaptor subunit n=1 Tax=Rheinheimera pacifica TaxID=173990 RepID=UPI00285EE2F1|nr:efflux RND transporter periplasmic adaptor subunit [Rheinheimera pacifica]MDR6981651.1 RND family efflux transporter MFP subunit [Rheinheimera pacifica]